MTLKPWRGRHKHLCCTLGAVKGKPNEAGSLHSRPPRLEPDVAENLLLLGGQQTKCSSFIAAAPRDGEMLDRRLSLPVT